MLHKKTIRRIISHDARVNYLVFKIILQIIFFLFRDIEKYFNELRKAEKKRLKQKADRAKLKKLCKKKYILEQEKKAYNLFSKILKQAFQYAINHQIPPLVSVRLRNLSNVILEQLCDILCCKKPDRYDENKNCTFLVSIADWIAIEIERVYYIINLKKNLELEKIEELEIEQEKLKEKEKPLPVNDEVEIQMDQAEDGNLDEME